MYGICQKRINIVRSQPWHSPLFAGSQDELSKTCLAPQECMTMPLQTLYSLSCCIIGYRLESTEKQEVSMWLEPYMQLVPLY